jgi:hypothetical protein
MLGYTGETLIGARGVGFAEDFDDFGVGKPFRNRGAGSQSSSQFWEFSKVVEMGIPVPEMSIVFMPFGTSSLGIYSSMSGR